MRYGFLMDQTKCIGCHACTVACKSEHDVPLGSFRTWVTSTETGVFPNASRHFQVNRCNHCENAPCVDICPTGALFIRPDGIVDFDNSKCIGCKACMAACPYDAIYIDPIEDTAAKCNYCAHRIDNDMLPACVIVCPEKAILAGDLDDAESEISQVLATHPTAVRKPEQGTRPKVFYLGADASTLDPTLPFAEASYSFSARAEAQPITFQALPQELKVRPKKVYDTPHNRQPWGRLVSLYLWTKSVAAGLGGVAALLVLLRPATGVLASPALPAVALLFLLATTLLLIFDLKHPERFWMMLLRPHWTSWLVRGGIVLTAYGVLLAAWIAMAVLGIRPPGLFLGAVVAVAALTAGYSAFLFAQAEARDFWQSPLVFWHLLAQATVAGSAALAALSGLALLPETRWIFLGGLLAHLALAFGDLLSRHASREARLASEAVLRGALRRLFWLGAVTVGGTSAIALFALGLTAGSAVLVAFGLAFAMAGLLLYEHLWVRAGQIIPLS